MVYLVFSLHVFAYILSLAASLEAGFSSQKFTKTSSNTGEEWDLNPKRSLTQNAEKIENDFLKSTNVNTHQRAVLLQKRLKKIKYNIGIERSKNRTRKQKKEIVNATLSHADEERTRETKSQNKMYESKNVDRHNSKSEISLPKNQENNGGSTSHPVKTATVKSSLFTRHPTASESTRTKSGRTGKKSIRMLGSDGRSKNRPQRNRRRKLHLPRRHRLRSRHEDSKGQPSRFDTGSGGNMKETPLEKDSAVPRTISEEEVKEIRLNMFVKNMADKLRMTPDELMTLPNRRTAPKFPRYLLKETLQDKAVQERVEPFYAQDQKVILAGHDLGRNCIAKRTSGCYSFDLASNVRGEVASAQLWVYKTPDRNDTSVQTFLLYGLERLRSGRVLAQNQIQRQDSYVKEGWVVINITRTVTSWVQDRKSKEMIAIRCSTCVTRNHKALYGTKQGYKPLIVIKYLKLSTQYRGKRANDNCDPEFDCCKRRLNVDFRSIRMLTVAAPPELAVGYCYGTCNSPNVYTHNHTMIKQRIRFASDDASDEMREKLTPCCVPVAFRPAMLLIRTSTSGMVTHMPDAIVHRCGCV